MKHLPLRVDPITSRRMSLIRQAGTTPELRVRALLTALGARYRISNRDLEGSPDLANRSRKWAIFVHGCFWHRHPACKRATTPKRNRRFWLEKFEANVRRDHRARTSLVRLGLHVVTVWECESERPDFDLLLAKRLNLGQTWSGGRKGGAVAERSTSKRRPEDARPRSAR